MTLWWGDVPRWCRVDLDMAVETEPLELVEDALEWEWWWWWIERIDETDEDVDFLPRRPVEDRLMADRGVSGEGDNDCRL